MAKLQNGVESRNIAKNFNWLCRMHERYRRQTELRRQIPEPNVRVKTEISAVKLFPTVTVKQTL